MAIKIADQFGVAPDNVELILTAMTNASKRSPSRKVSAEIIHVFGQCIDQMMGNGLTEHRMAAIVKDLEEYPAIPKFFAYAHDRLSQMRVTRNA